MTVNSAAVEEYAEEEDDCTGVTKYYFIYLLPFSCNLTSKYKPDFFIFLLLLKLCPSRRRLFVVNMYSVSARKRGWSTANCEELAFLKLAKNKKLNK